MLRVVLLASAAVAPAAARAAPITFAFTGHVVTVGSQLADVGAPFAVGQSVSGRYTFDGGSFDGAPSNPAEGLYSSLTSLDFAFGSYSGSGSASDGLTVFAVLNDFLPNLDTYDVLFFAHGPELLGSSPYLEVSLADHSGAAFTSDALPVVPPDLAAFDSAEVILGFATSGPAELARVHAQIDSLVLVPEPARSALAAAVVSLLCLTRAQVLRRSRQNARIALFRTSAASHCRK